MKMIKAALAATLLATSAAPAMAQDDAAEAELAGEVMGKLATLFQADPLNEEQEARLPAASAAVAQMMPEGFYGRMMGDVFDRIMGPMFEAMGAEIIQGQIRKQVGMNSFDLPELDEGQLAEISAILDPVAKQRMQLMTDGMTTGMIGMFAKIEPAMRDGMSRAYAVRFTGDELADINTFFATPTGGKYAAESMAIMADPQVMSGMMQAMPAVMQELPALIEQLKVEEAKLPQPNGYDDLSDAQRECLAELLGLNKRELAKMMAQAASANNDE